MDLAEGHVSALQYVEAKPTGAHTYSVFNLGSGVGCSVLDMVEAMKVASGRPLPYEFAPRRAGDIAVCYADTKKASEVLGWTAKRHMADMCKGMSFWRMNASHYKLILWQYTNSFAPSHLLSVEKISYQIHALTLALQIPGTGSPTTPTVTPNNLREIFSIAT